MIPASKRRLASIALIAVALLSVLGVRLYNLQVRGHSSYVALASQDQVRSVVTPAVRGEILDDTGQVMVGRQSELVVAVNMATLGQQSDGGAAELSRLARLLKVSEKTLQERVRICTKGVQQPCWQGSPYQPIPVAQNVPQPVALQLLEDKSAFPGVSADIQPVTDYNQPLATDAAGMVGYLQPITPQELKALNEPVTGFTGDDLVGQAGLEAQYDAALRGTTGVDEVATNAAGQVTSTIKDIKPVAGDDLVTSINGQLQIDVENILANSVQQAHADNPGANSGAAVVMTTTGQVVAMASYPTYDPSVWTNGLSEKEFKRLFGTADGEPILERATQGEYPPGSTWKVTTLTAGIRFGDSLYGSYDCPAAVTVDGHTFKNDSGNEGQMSLHQALVVSCDTVFYNMGYQIWQADHRKDDTVTSPTAPVQFEQKIELDWGFGKDTGVDLPQESPGTVPTRQWLYYYWKDNAHTGQDWCKYGRANGSYVQQIEYDDCRFGNIWEPGQAIIASIGQGYINVTPLQLARAYAALANGGTLYSPRIGEELVSPSGKVVEKITPPVVGHLPASKNTLAYIRSALQGVVTSGTAAGTFGSFPLNRVCVAGKTGTAQVFGKNSTSVFASFAPCNDPRYVVVMMIPDSGYGADVSGPGVRQIWDAIYGLQGAKASLPGGKLPAVPHITTAGRVVQTTPTVSPTPRSSPKSGAQAPVGLPFVQLPADTAVGGKPRRVTSGGP
ncbi:MAG TPA: penicillin-binding protein 2 [Streptosporangiaceae bacterium]|nr:penicillin-binding protein 2 [Streptosporangiaceae bacterium]